MLSPARIFFAGKGGVGKTTCAAARAIAEAARGRRVLVVSTDPAHSLGDVLGVRLSARPARAEQRLASLFAAEIDARRGFARWLARHRRPLGDILEQGTWLDREDVEALLDLSIPGIDELVGLLEIERLSESARADLVVVDTAPTGHTLRLLASPETVGAVAGVLEALHEQHRLIRDRLARVGRQEASDRLIALLTDQASDLATRLRDRRRTVLQWVTLPEDLSIAETADALAAMRRARLHVGEVIVNRVIPPGPRCPICDRRRADERRAIGFIQKRFGRGRRVRVIAAERREPIGIKALAKIGTALMSASSRYPKYAASELILRQAQDERKGPLALSLSKGEPTAAAETLTAIEGAHLFFVGGKGGVGKTTVAAASALRTAAAHPDQRVLLMSTDPAHSLGDVLEATTGDAAAPVRGAPTNLDVRELDAARAWAARRAEVEAAFDKLAESLTGGTVGPVGARVSELLDLAPPGVDELFGLLSVFEARDDYDTIVIDTAPTGHALRLLMTPDDVREWVQALLRMLLKYKSLVKPGQLAEELVGVSKSIRAFSEVLRDARQTRFLVVTRLAAAPVAETIRLVRRLRSMKFAIPAIVVNAMTLAPGRCPICRATQSAEERAEGPLRSLVRRGGTRRCAIIHTPLSAPPPRGTHALEAWAGQWVVDG